MKYAEQRTQLEANLKRLGINTARVLHAILSVKREAFLAPEFQDFAYLDEPLPIAEDQTISQPSLVGYMTGKLKLKKTDRVLEVGTGSGYQTAVLAELARKVFTIEVRKALSLQAQSVLKKLGYKNINFKIGNGLEGWKDEAPFDAIIVTAAINQPPTTLFDQLKVGGRFVAPISANRIQTLHLFEKTEDGLQDKRLFPVKFVEALN